LSSIKQSLRARCIESIQQRIDASRDAIRLLQQSANEETKSSAGDKYETGRAMAQLEIEKLGVQLASATAQLAILNSISPGKHATHIQLGSVGVTNQGNFYLAASIGLIQIDGEKYFVVSPASPVGQRLVGLTVGESFVLNGKTFEVLEVM
jgi:transcription elongation GreA/GreB family factor